MVLSPALERELPALVAHVREHPDALDLPSLLPLKALMSTQARVVAQVSEPEGRQQASKQGSSL